jgi:DNA-binding MarR family transcriptional regulator
LTTVSKETYTTVSPETKLPMNLPTKTRVSPLDAHLGFWLRFVSNHVSSEFQKLVEQSGVSVSEWVALRALYDVQESTHALLMSTLGMTKGAVSKVVSRLQEKGFIERSINELNSRAQLLALTESGRALVPRLAGLADRNDARFFAHLPNSEREQLMTTMKAIAAFHQLKEVPVV